jgi:hypothetical protein
MRKWSITSINTTSYLISRNMISLTQYLSYAGKLDQINGSNSIGSWLQKPTAFDYDNYKLWTNARKILYVKNTDNTTYTIGGYYSLGGYYRTSPGLKFTYLTIPNADHFVPSTMLITTISMLNYYLSPESIEVLETSLE